MIKSRNNKLWLIQEESPSFELKTFCNNDLVAKVLSARQIKTKNEALYYLGSERPSFSSPLEIPQIEKAIERIEKAINKQENIIVYGDYDVDGTTSTALLVSCLQILGAKVSFYIPNRFTEGYGLNSKAIVQLKSQKKANLLITCDCGITNIEEVHLAQSIGLDVIVTDHHSLPEELPPAIAVLNPKLLPENHPLHWLPGVGVAYKLSEALLERACKKNYIEPLLDFVALGMIADLAPLRAENRLLVQDGLKILNKTERPGLKALLSECGYQSDEESVGFMIAPRINAAGRLNDANQAVALFLSQDPAEAQILARGLTEQNKSRQGLCDETFLQAVEKIENEVNLKESKAILLADKRWHHGVVGIVASRLVEKYHLPVFLAVEEDDEKIKGSARGIPSLDLFVELSKHGHLFSKFGGHKAAAGFSLTKGNWGKFGISLQQELHKVLKPSDLQATLDIDAAVSLIDLNFKQLDPVWALAPFGMGFHKPAFALEKPAELVELKALGKSGEHSKLVLREDNKTIEAVQWRVAPHEFREAQKQGKIKIAFSPNKRNFNGNTFLQLEIKDWLVEKDEMVKIRLPQFTDYRRFNNPKEKLKELYTENNLIFAEGESLKEISDFDLHGSLVQRFKLKNKKCQKLIFWSLPTDKEIIKQNLQNYFPDEIIVFGRNLEKEINLKNFLREILVYIKKEAKNAKLEINLKTLAAALEVQEKTCYAALNLLQESGILNFKFVAETVNINLFNSPNKVQLNTQNLQERLLEEQKIKQKFLLNSLSSIIC